MRPVLKPTFRRYWRDPDTVQFGIDPERAVVLTGLRDTSVLDLIDGTRDSSGVIATATDPVAAAHLLDLLSSAGLLADASADTSALAALPTAERDRLAPDLAALARHGDALRAFERRQAATVVVYGAGRIGAPLAALLAACGIGRVVPRDDELVRPADAAPGGVLAGATGETRGAAARRAISRFAPSTQTAEVPGAEPTLAVIADGRSDVAALLAARHPHLLVGTRDGIGVVGPLVRPGNSPCTRCLDLHRSDRDPQWAAVAAQLRGMPSAGCDVLLAAALAVCAAMQVIALVEGHQPATVGGTLELAPPDWRWRRKSWSMHPRCECSSLTGK